MDLLQPTCGKRQVAILTSIVKASNIALPATAVNIPMRFFSAVIMRR
jgi:hypothetical protein